MIHLTPNAARMWDTYCGGLILASISSCLVINFGGGFRSRLTSHPLNRSLSRRKAAEEPCLLNRFNRTEEYRLDDGNWPQ